MLDIRVLVRPIVSPRCPKSSAPNGRAAIAQPKTAQYLRHTLPILPWGFHGCACSLGSNASECVHTFEAARRAVQLSSVPPFPYPASPPPKKTVSSVESSCAHARSQAVSSSRQADKQASRQAGRQAGKQAANSCPPLWQRLARPQLHADGKQAGKLEDVEAFPLRALCRAVDGIEGTS